MNKIAFFHFPRTGGSFIACYIRDYLIDYFIGIGHQCYRHVEEQVKNSYSVAFIRNPYEWYVSRYFYFAADMNRSEAGISINCDSGLWGKEFLEKFPTFEDHYFWGMNNVENFSMQYRFNEMLTDENGDIAMDFIGINENIYNDFKFILNANDIPLPPVRLKEYYELHNAEIHYTNASTHKHYSQYHTPETIKSIATFDKYILDNFNYKFEENG
jgi:hypothetical protein